LASLPCGDIDALFARPLPGNRILIVVCEVKDWDLPWHRENAFEVEAQKTEKAFKQLRTKAAWLAQHWAGGFARATFPELAVYQSGTILKVLVTRNRSTLELASGAECVPLPTLQTFLNEICGGLGPWFEGARKASVVEF
jgi:hypothetical protein